MDGSSELRIIENSSKAVSRRKFIKGVIAGGAAVSSANYLFRSSLVHGQASGASDRLITLTVNGRQRRVDVMKQETLAWTLRYKLGLTGTKLGCDRAECGACTVLIGDVPHYSCSLLTHTVRSEHVTTIEGLAAADGTLHPVQQGIIDEQGFQCAFCMSGFVMATVGFLKTNPSPSPIQPLATCCLNKEAHSWRCRLMPGGWSRPEWRFRLRSRSYRPWIPLRTPRPRLGFWPFAPAVPAEPAVNYSGSIAR